MVAHRGSDVCVGDVAEQPGPTHHTEFTEKNHMTHVSLL